MVALGAGCASIGHLYFTLPRDKHMGLMDLLRAAVQRGRPPAPAPGSLPQPVSYQDACSAAAVGRADDRSRLVLEDADLRKLVARVYASGRRTGGIFQTYDAGSAGHIEVLGNVDGVERLVGWICEKPERAESRPATPSFQFRELEHPLARYQSLALLRSHSTTSQEPAPSTSWNLSSLARILEIAAACNFQVTGIAQNISGSEAFIGLVVGANGETARGTITALPGKQIQYHLNVAVGPKPALEGVEH